MYVKLQNCWMPIVICMASCWLENQDENFSYSEIQALKKCILVVLESGQIWSEYLVAKRVSLRTLWMTLVYSEYVHDADHWASTQTGGQRSTSCLMIHLKQIITITCLVVVLLHPPKLTLQTQQYNANNNNICRHLKTLEYSFWPWVLGS